MNADEGKRVAREGEKRVNNFYSGTRNILEDIFASVDPFRCFLFTLFLPFFNAPCKITFPTGNRSLLRFVRFFVKRKKGKQPR